MPEINFKTKRKLTKSLLKFVEGQPRYVRIDSPIYLGRDIDKKTRVDADVIQKKREPAHLCEAINLETGEEVQIIVSAVVKSVLEEEYQNNSYVGLSFKITKTGRVPGKQYMAFDIEEIELDSADRSTKLKSAK